MPSKRRLRHTSSSNAPPQVLLNSAKSGSLSGPATPTSSTLSMTLTTAATTNQIPKSNSSPNNVSGGDSSNDGGLTEKQLRNAYLLTLTKEQLRAECRKRGQKTTGNRTELVTICLMWKMLMIWFWLAFSVGILLLFVIFGIFEFGFTLSSILVFPYVELQ